MPNKAMTLIELIIGLMISAVMASVVVVSFNSIEGRRLDVQARNMVADLIWARQIAASRHNNCTVVFDTANNRYRFYNGTVNPDNLVKNQSLSVDLASVTNWGGSAISQITFISPAGKASSTALITLSQINRSRRINVSDDTGFVRME